MRRALLRRTARRPAGIEALRLDSRPTILASERCVLASGHCRDSIVSRDWPGTTLQRPTDEHQPAARVGRRLGAPATGLARPRLHENLRVDADVPGVAASEQRTETWVDGLSTGGHLDPWTRSARRGPAGREVTRRSSEGDVEIDLVGGSCRQAVADVSGRPQRSTPSWAALIGTRGSVAPGSTRWRRRPRPLALR